MNLDFFFLYLGDGVCAHVTAYNELRYGKDCTSVSYGLNNQITFVFYLNSFIETSSFQIRERLYLGFIRIT